jgi:hypothetical protein
MLALLPLLDPPHLQAAADMGLAPSPWVFVAGAAIDHASLCPPDQGGGDACGERPCCGMVHAGCCPLLIDDIVFPTLPSTLPQPRATAAFVNLRDPPPRPPPIASSGR